MGISWEIDGKNITVETPLDYTSIKTNDDGNGNFNFVTSTNKNNNLPIGTIVYIPITEKATDLKAIGYFKDNRAQILVNKTV
jgi:hypothetical protein